MVEAILGRKKGMTQFFGEAGQVVPVTVIEAGPCVVTQVKTEANDGYEAVQLTLTRTGKAKRTPKAMKNHLAKAGVGSASMIREVRDAGTAELGAAVTAGALKDVKWVDVIGVSKGKGFQGVVKRHGFTGGKASHGSMFGRVPGSIGGSSDPSRVFKGMRATGHDGHRRVTMKNLELVGVDDENGILLVRGSVPGPINSLVVVRRARTKA